jgi:serine/threonine-protein kinase
MRDDTGAATFQRARAVFEAALDAPSADRPLIVERACAGDAVLLAAVQGMLRADAEPHPMLDSAPTPMSTRWSAGTLVAGHLRIASLAGRGGMGEVYRARDESLGRDVAVKVLPSAALDTPGLQERLARFEREAQILAALNHPNIAAIYGVADDGATRALVLEFVEGPTLADRLVKGPLPLDDVVSIGRQIAVALEAAHEQGIVHRDMKPSNIKLRPDGTVKLLDFGLAKVVQAENAGVGGPTSSPAITSPSMLQRGALFGTAAYMSPEQARGREADRRGDVWAFGAVLYEMLSGERAFKGDDAVEALAAVLRGDIDMSRLPAATPSALRQLVTRCLERNPSRRLRDIGEARIVLEDLEAAPLMGVAPAAAARERPRWRGALAIAAGAAAVLIPAAAWMLRVTPSPAPPALKRFAIDLPGEQLFPVRTGKLLSVSADGQTVVYLAIGGPDRLGRLYRRRLDDLESVPIGDVGAREPSTSPDGRWVAYVVGDTTLKKAPTAGGPSQTLTQLPTYIRGIGWANDGSLVVGSFSNNSGLLRVPATGGPAQPLTSPGPGPMHWDPQVLPDGRHILFTASAPNAPSTVMVLDLQTSKTRALVPGALVRLLPNGPLVYLRDNALWAVPFDAVRLDATGSAVRLVDSVRVEVGGALQVSMADDGTVAYLEGSVAPRTLVTLDRSGRAAPLVMPARSYEYVRVSPDGRRMAVSIRDQNADIWIWSFDRQTLTRLTLDAAVDTSPVWTPDGTRVVFASRRGGDTLNPYWQAADGTDQAERLVDTVNTTDQFSMAPDGRRLLMRLTSTSTGDDIAMLNVAEQPRRLQSLISTRFNERDPVVSPDGRWLAYDSDESGRREVYVRPFPDVERGRWQVSTSGGYSPRWASGGRELTFVAANWDWLAVQVIDGAAFRIGAATRVANPAQGATTETYDIFPDGKKFVAVQSNAAPGSKRLTILLNVLSQVAR